MSSTVQYVNRAKNRCLSLMFSSTLAIELLMVSTRVPERLTKLSSRGVRIRQLPIFEHVRDHVCRVIDPAGGNLVAGKRRAAGLATDGLRRQRIENLPLQDRLARAGIYDSDRKRPDNALKSPARTAAVGTLSSDRFADNCAQLLPAEEEEGLVFAYRPAQGGAVLILV